MRAVKQIALLACLGLSLLTILDVEAEKPPEYTLGSGDEISILVFGEEDLSLETKLGDSGTLNYPFLGKLNVAGMTVSELQNTITEGLLGDYLIEPKVSVNIIEYRQIFVTGQVRKPGGFSFQPGLTVGKAITLAEGFTERANEAKVFVISENDTAKQPRRVGLGTFIQPGDIITVEEGFF